MNILTGASAPARQKLSVGGQLVAA
ncbi:TPA: hypothetical protein ACV198_005487, partial [Escherichia coli]